VTCWGVELLKPGEDPDSVSSDELGRRLSLARRRLGLDREPPPTNYLRPGTGPSN